MSEEIEIEGVSYISSRRAAQISGYAQDYIGQLCRAGNVRAERVGGLWYLNLDSLYQYKQKADAYIPVAPRVKSAQKSNSFITLDGKDYISTSRASEITGYHKDYVGQLARESTIPSRQVGNRWYVERGPILDHKKEKDALLAAVQVESVGLAKQSLREERHVEAFLSEFEPMKYSSEHSDLLPVVADKPEAHSAINPVLVAQKTASSGDEGGIHTRHAIPIKIYGSSRPISDRRVVSTPSSPRTRLPMSQTIIAGIATIVIFIAVGVFSMKEEALYAVNSVVSSGKMTALSGKTYSVFMGAGGFLEALIVDEIVYRRSDWVVSEE